ncbi:SNF2-related protein [Symbiobacterium terraclitae]|uniref:SNF2-related protein n=1 Tax=Symbiobacterium terraclitae TaxID=557451 RepID=UPI0035B559E8
MSVPLYLAEPDTTGYTYGTLRYDRLNGYYIVEAEPAVLEMARRVFPGCDTREPGRVRFKATTRIIGDLNWLMLRFPLKILDQDAFDQHRQKAIAHALRRDTNLKAAGPVTPPPTFTGKLLPFQEEGVGFLVRNERCLLADDMGLGKTVQALAALAAADAFPALVVAPTNVQLQWQRQAATFLDLPTLPTVGQQRFVFEPADRARQMARIIKGLKPYPLPRAPLYIIHYGLLRGWRDILPSFGFKAVVFDEIQELRHTGTEKYSVASLLSSSADLVWGLSGTPIYNYGDEIWAVMNAIEYHCLGDRDAFTREWCTGYGEKVVRDPAVLGDYLRREGLMLRRRKADVQDQLPPKRRVVHVVNHDEDRYQAMIREAAELAARYDRIRDWHERGKAALEIEGASRRAAGVAKAPYVAAFVRSLLEAGERVLLYAYHHEVHDMLSEALRDFRPVRITGRETPREKEEALRAFASGETNLVQLSLRSTAGIDGLQGRGTVVVFAELDWSPAIHSQCEDRLHRMGVGELDSVLCYYLVSDTGMDEVMQEALGLKIGQFVGIMGDQAPSADEEILARQAAERHLGQVIEVLKRLKAS